MINTTENIYLQFHKELKLFIKSRVSDYSDVEDILHEVFEKVHRNIRTLNQPQKLKPWLLQICRTTIIDFHRKNDHDIEFDETRHVLSGNDFGEEDSKLIDRCLLSLTGRLKDGYRQAVLKADFEQKPLKVIADEENLSLSGIKSRVRRGRSQLREALTSCCQIEFDRYRRPFSILPPKECPDCDTKIC